MLFDEINATFGLAETYFRCLTTLRGETLIVTTVRSSEAKQRLHNVETTSL